MTDQQVAAARLWASARVPYLASALFACSVRSAPGSSTIGIDDGWRVAADPDVLATMTVPELGRLLVHLTGHVLRDHARRATNAGVQEGDEAARWNRCADAEINDDLLTARCVPQCAPDMPRDLKCKPGGLVERYYADAADGSRSWDCGSGADGCPRPGDGPVGIARDQAELIRLGVAAEIHRAHAREPGTVAGGWLRWAETVLPSRTDWRRVLAAEVRRAVAAVAGQVDYSYRRPSRRAGVAGDVVLPAMQRPVPDVAIVCDTSGSMHDRLLARALAEVEGVLSRAGLRQQQVRVLSVDTDVHAARRVRRAADVALAGGGGTDMSAGLAAAENLSPRPSVVVVLTDGYTPWPPAPPRNMRVVVGLLTEGFREPGWAPPAWARMVLIDD